jgi:5'-nucleotidase/UDP-sugar diphosphatase
MRKWIMLLLALVLAFTVLAAVIGCGSNAPEKPKETVKPAEAPAPAAPAPAATPEPAPAAPAATKQ